MFKTLVRISACYAARGRSGCVNDYNLLPFQTLKYKSVCIYQYIRVEGKKADPSAIIKEVPGLF